MVSADAADPAGTAAASLPDWIERQFRFSAGALLGSISATHLVKKRLGFFQRIVPAPGSVLASPALAAYDPDPDYFFHWFRDAALVVEGLRVLVEENAAGPAGLERFAEFLRFNLALKSARGDAWLDGSLPLPDALPKFRQFLRPEIDLAAVSGERVFAETRVNPDGTVDVIRWNRPQTDGAALRALTLLRFWPMALEESLRPMLRELIEDDLAFTLRHWREAAYDIWEDDLGDHYYTRRVQAAALSLGADWLNELGEPQRAAVCATAAAELTAALDAHWSDELGAYRSGIGPAQAPAYHTLDIASILAIIHARALTGPHSVVDPRVQATLMRLEDLFEAEFPTNRRRLSTQAPALGRFAGDVYYGGGAFYLATLGAAEFYFQLAESLAGPGSEPAPASAAFFRRAVAAINTASPADSVALPANPHDLARALLARGDMFLATVQAFTPESGELSEQFDRSTGAQTSAKNLTWSYAAFITAIAARRRALRLLG